MPAARKKPIEPVKIRLKKNDVVKVITGRDKGKQGRVIEIDRRTGKIVVEHVMMMKRHTKPNPAKQIKGGIAERESPIHVSNVKKVEKEGKQLLVVSCWLLAGLARVFRLITNN